MTFFRQPVHFRLVSAVAVAGFALLVSGCRHQTTMVVRQAPAALPAHAGAAGTPVVAHAGGKPSAGAPLSPETTPTVGLDDVSGKPVSVEFGTASWYGPPYNNRAAADGSIFDQNAMTAAHRTLPMGSTVRVTNVATRQSVVVRITDRGPFSPGRILDLSEGAAKAIGVWRPGVAQVKVEAFAHPTSDPAGHWCVQIGAFKKPEDARGVKAALALRFKDAKVLEFAGPTGHWVRIHPGTPDLVHANQVARAVASPDPAALPYVVRTN